MIPSLAYPHCYVDIYPFEGGVFTIRGDSGALLSCNVTTGVKSSYGTFSLGLAPGGPYGPNVTPQWADVITPMSLVVIGMQRAGRANVVMVGVVRTIGESEAWIAGSGVQRQVNINGLDFGYFFQMQNYYTQALLNATAGSAFGVSQSLSVIDQGLIAGTPDNVGAAWYNDIMAGPKSIMAKTSFSYQGSRPTFFDLTATYFQPYSDVDIRIPTGDNFMSADGTWIDKFRELFPFPWYEFFVVTAPPGTYAGGSASVPINMSMPGFVPANPQVVARVNPLPWTKNVGASVSDLSLQMDFSKWDLLPQYTLDNGGAIAKQLVFDDSDVRNFYMVNTKWVSNLIGLRNDNQTPFTWLFASWVDTASIHRYGYRPDVSELHWFTDIDGLQAKQYQAAHGGITPFDLAVGNLALKKTSYHEPSAMMARTQVTTNLRPDILPGNRFLFSPRKDIEMWEFYIESVTHSYQFGGMTTTTLSLSRGLPQSVYSDDNLMTALHTGNGMRQNGQYVTGIPAGLGQGLQPLNFLNASAVIGQVAEVFAVPGAK